jgi:hypothetical protein
MVSVQANRRTVDMLVLDIIKQMWTDMSNYEQEMSEPWDKLQTWWIENLDLLFAPEACFRSTWRKMSKYEQM